MDLKPGELYFINEQDIRTGERSNYYKIGIVYAHKRRDSTNRLLEHQTGNPRQLHIVETMNIQGVRAVEINLHHLFARHRAKGEWMWFSEAELQAAISKAKQLASEMPDFIKDVEKSEELEHMLSNGIVLPATDEAKQLYAIIMNFKPVIKKCKNLKDQYKKYLEEAIKKGVDIGGKATYESRPGTKRFDESMFSTKYPQLFKKYLETKRVIAGPFNPQLNKDWVADPLILEKEQWDLISDFEEQLAKADHKLDSDFSLHASYLGIKEILAYADWQNDKANTKLRVLTGVAEGIEEICRWKRIEKETIFLDKEKLEANHLEEYMSCQIKGAETQVLKVNPGNAPVR